MLVVQAFLKDIWLTQLNSAQLAHANKKLITYQILVVTRRMTGKGLIDMNEGHFDACDD